MRKLILISTAIAPLAAPAQALATTGLGGLCCA
jgi:hypothetical protein